LQAGMGKRRVKKDEKRSSLSRNPPWHKRPWRKSLEFDSVGRKMRRGSDFAGAAKAFRAAQQWDPDDPAITGDLAVLLEYNDEAEHYARNAKLDEAIAEYRKLTEQQVQKIGFKNNLAFALLYASKLDDAKKEAERLNPQPKAFIVAAEAVTLGSKAGLAQAQKITSGEDESKTVTKAAGDIAMRYRAYPQAAVCLRQAPRAATRAMSWGSPRSCARRKRVRT
jgi:Flp pilus assembly protein TadD